MAELNASGNLEINAYNFADFLQEIEQAVINGFTFDLTKNETYPQKYGDHLYVCMVPAGSIEVTGLNEVTPEDLVFDPEVDAQILADTAQEPETEPEVIPEVTPEVEPEIVPEPVAGKKTRRASLTQE